MFDEHFYRHNPQPSKRILQLGQVVEDSYFLVDGFLHVEKLEDIVCKFEVAHMQDGISWAVVYVEFSTEPTDQLRKRFAIDEPNYLDTLLNATKLIGKDSFLQREIEVSIDGGTAQRGGAFNPGVQIVFQVSDYRVIIGNDAGHELKNAEFWLTNLPLAKQYDFTVSRNNDRSQFLDSVNENALSAAIYKVIDAKSQVELSKDELFKLGIEEADATKRRLLEHVPIAHSRQIDISINKEVVASLYWLCDYKEREYSTQPVSRLSVNLNKIPNSWTPEIVADWICGILSIALGRVVTWNYYHLAQSIINDNDDRVIYRTWRSRFSPTNKFLPFTEKRDQLEIIGFEESSHAIHFVQDALAYIFQYPVEATENYFNVIQDYVYYASSSTDYQHRCTLLCALVENLFKQWKTNTKIVIENETDDGKISKILEAIKVAIEEIFDEIMPQEEGENTEAFAKRRDEYVNRIRSTVGNNLAHSFEHRLTEIFKTGNWTETSIRPRINAFVLSRNKLFHEHSFALETTENNQSAEKKKLKVFKDINNKEIQNIELFIPLIFATILHYKGRYWDKVSNGWAWMPNFSTEG